MIFVLDNRFVNRQTCAAVVHLLHKYVTLEHKTQSYAARVYLEQ